jgi:hypothetical protein
MNKSNKFSPEAREVPVKLLACVGVHVPYNAVIPVGCRDVFLGNLV